MAIEEGHEYKTGYSMLNTEQGMAKDSNTMSEHEMSVHDIKETFKKDFIDEVNDSNTYLDMAKAAEGESSNEHFIKGLYEMAKDEYTHAKFIHEMLVDWGCEIPENELMKWHMLKERVDRVFR